jgi:hypothetical protein
MNNRLQAMATSAFTFRLDRGRNLQGFIDALTRRHAFGRSTIDVQARGNNLFTLTFSSDTLNAVEINDMLQDALTQFNLN